jgi:hypothetical protein
LANTQLLGSIWRGRAWDDGEQIPRLQLPSNLFAEAIASLAYGWNGSAFQKIAIDATTGGLTVIDANTSLTPTKTFANVSASSTDSNIVTAVGGKKVRVVAFAAVCGGTATTLTFNSKPAGVGTAITMQFQNAANGGEVLNFNPVGWFDTNTGEGLTVTTGAGSTTGVQVVYTLI